MTAKTVIHKLKHHFARYGICQTLISDNAPIFHSAEFKQFEMLYKFHHKYTSPCHQSANPADRAVKTCKNLMKKAKREHQDIYLALLLHRNIQMQAFNSSPAQKEEQRQHFQQRTNYSSQKQLTQQCRKKGQKHTMQNNSFITIVL